MGWSLKACAKGAASWVQLPRGGQRGRCPCIQAGMLSRHFQNRNVLMRWSSGVSYPTGLSMQIAQLGLHSLRRYSGCQGGTTLRGQTVCDNETWSQRPRPNGSSEEGNEEATLRDGVWRYALINWCWQNERSYKRHGFYHFNLGK